MTPELSRALGAVLARGDLIGYDEHSDLSAAVARIDRLEELPEPVQSRLEVLARRAVATGGEAERFAVLL